MRSCASVEAVADSLADRPTHARLMEGEAWRANADATFKSITDTLVRLDKKIDAIEGRREGVLKNVLGYIVGSVGVIGGAAVFFVSSEVNTALSPLAQQVAAVQSSVRAEDAIMDRLQDGLQKGHDDRTNEQISVRERLSKIETVLDLIKHSELK